MQENHLKKLLYRINQLNLHLSVSAVQMSYLCLIKKHLLCSDQSFFNPAFYKNNSINHYKLLVQPF